MSSAPSSADADSIAVALADAAARVLDAVAGVEASNPVVLIDGRSGSGKSTLARLLVDGWPQEGCVQLVALDLLYPGWDGLQAGAQTARDRILLPHARGDIGIWRRWDWQAAAPAEAHAVIPSLPLIVEGAGLLTAAAAPLGDVRVWLESPAPSRMRRALERDGDAYRPHWGRWAAQEDDHIARDAPAGRATHAFAIP